MNEIKISIFTVFVWRVVEEKKRLELHLVAGLNSADAERRIKESHAEHLAGVAFITTDERNEMNADPAVRLYTTRFSNSDDVSDEEFKTWIRAMLHTKYEDGEKTEPGVRRI